ncbi:hypothetical protein SKAU_G00271480 [Synaphobranchus kaupii]|uniref:Uncharacterized protein n=1 Tax=Synaphobranchus kaupii TaxID=118154 RepID=A0A9Q1F0N8_SYNKA|nr:hypothetical protein SKAU_G00271480 [Synaphobranchus kaupii]
MPDSVRPGGRATAGEESRPRRQAARTPAERPAFFHAAAREHRCSAAVGGTEKGPEFEPQSQRDGIACQVGVFA